MLKLCIITQLLGFFTLAITMNQLPFALLIILIIVLIPALLFTNNLKALRAIQRFKWFFLVTLLIFAFNTPGEHLDNWPFLISPTYEGLQAGAAQALRIACMLVVLSLIFAKNTKQQLISGFYFILMPLKYLKFPIEKFAARLWLTLHYVELQNTQLQQASTHGALNQHVSYQGLIHRLKNMTELKNSNYTADFNSIELRIPTIRLLDYVVIVLLLAVVVKVFV